MQQFRVGKAEYVSRTQQDDFGIEIGEEPKILKSERGKIGGGSALDHTVRHNDDIRFITNAIDIDMRFTIAGEDV